MPTVDVRITSMYPPGEVGSIRGYASATIASCLAIRGIKVVEGGERGLFVSMPSRKTTEGYKEVCFPVTAEFREQLHSAVLSAYQQALEQSVAQQTAPQPEAPEQAGEEPGLQM
ncbi:MULTISPECIES: SpoVG family protein [Enterocloster]|uniref:SpoVG family protein n=1 Tax=Enterocloster TaxID=2719313 RepID=UPI0022DF7D07|nr:MULTISPECIES: SpoVG family protein [Enterocloster]